MANLTEQQFYDAAVYELATTDPVLGGPGGVDNQPHKQLANRTAWLKQQVDALQAGGFISQAAADLRYDVINAASAAITAHLNAADPHAQYTTNAEASALIPNSNIIINSSFTINQRVYVSAAVLAANTFGHDRWKAGAAGGDYSFTQLDTSTQITVATGKSLIQVVDAPNVAGGTYTLSWTGTAQARFGISTKTPSGVFAVSPITITAQTPDTFMSVEFNAGTLSDVKLEQGSVSTSFTSKQSDIEYQLCLPYYEKSSDMSVPPLGAFGEGVFWVAVGTISPHEGHAEAFTMRKRAIPTVRIWNASTGIQNQARDYTNVSDVAASAGGSESFIFMYISAPVALHRYAAHWDADAEIY